MHEDLSTTNHTTLPQRKNQEILQKTQRNTPELHEFNPSQHIRRPGKPANGNAIGRLLRRPGPRLIGQSADGDKKECFLEAAPCVAALKAATRH